MSTEKEQALQILFGSIIEEMKESSSKKLEEISKSVEDKAEALEKKMATSLKKLDDILDNKPITVNFGTVEQPKNEVTHKAFDKILKVLQSAKRKDKHIMLVGGAGGGKTHLAGQIAKALNIPFYPMSVGLQTTKSDLLGFINATGGYMTTPVRKAYEEGGLLLLDEFDATHAGVVTILNSLLANGHATFPDKIIEKNEKFICLCACNTYGRGANIDYVGRNKLDGATLDRFIVIDVDYDTNLERTLANNDTWVDVIEKVRANIKKQGIKMIVSPRASIDGADLLEAGFSASEVMDMIVYKGCDEDIRKKVSQGIVLTSVRKRPNRKSENTESAENTLISEENPDNKSQKIIWLDFDRGAYREQGMDEGVIEWESSFSIKIGKAYNPLLSSSALYINKKSEFTDEKLVSDAEDSDIRHFCRSMKKWASKCPKKFLLRITYRGETNEIAMGE